MKNSCFFKNRVKIWKTENLSQCDWKSRCRLHWLKIFNGLAHDGFNQNRLIKRDLCACIFCTDACGKIEQNEPCKKPLPDWFSIPFSFHTGYYIGSPFFLKDQTLKNSIKNLCLDDMPCTKFSGVILFLWREIAGPVSRHENTQLK